MRAAHRDPLGHAVTRFNRRDFLGAHEILEAVLPDAGEVDAPLFEVVIRLATALHLRLNRGAERGSLNLLQQALVRLDDLRPERSGVDTAALYDDVTAYVERVRAAAGPAGFLERFQVPKIRLRTRR